MSTWSFGMWHRSFYFPAVQQGLWDEADPPPRGLWYCPSTFVHAEAGATLDFCRASRETTLDTMWRTGVYASDSSICQAALHAGFVGPDGGRVRVYERGPGKVVPNNTHFDTTRANVEATGA